MRLIERTFRALAPHDCLNCGQEGSLLCNWCSLDSIEPLPAQCYRCQRLSQDSRVCQRCRPQTRLNYVWVRTVYDNLAKQLVYELKFNRKQDAATVIAQLLKDSLPYLAPDTIIVHIPTSSRHIRQRGYDQANIIASQLALKLNRKHLTLLGRLGNARQVGNTRQTRLTQLRGAFRPLKGNLIRGAHILLIDDVLTTGGTLEAAAATLKKAGAKQVDAAVFARTQ